MYRSRSFSTIILVLFIGVVCNLFFCKLPSSPDDPSKTNVELVLRNSNWVQSSSTVSDSIGKVIQIGLAVYLPDNVDSIQMFIRAENGIVFDTVIKTFNGGTTDTTWIKMSFSTAGNKAVTINAYSKVLQFPPITGTITIHKSATIDPQENHAPKWTKDTITTDLKDTSKYVLELTSLCSDPDGDSIGFSIDGENVSGDTIISKQYIFQVTKSVTGRKNISLIGADSKSAKDTLYLIFNITSSDTTDTSSQNEVFTVTYDGNSSVSGNVPVDSDKYKAGALVTVKGNTGILVKTGFTFAGWNTAADGTGTAYAVGSTFSMGSGNVVLYARWTQSPTYTVTYNGNTNVSGTVPVDSGKYENGTIVTVKGNSGILVKTGFSFAGWNTAADGTGTAYAVGSTFTMGSGNVILYARWTQSPTFTVTYDGNTNVSGTVPFDSGKYESGTVVTVKGNTGILVKTGFAFAGWNTTKDGSGAVYFPGSEFKMGSSNVTLYAQWTVSQYTVKFNSQGGSTLDSVKVNHGELLTKPSDPTRSGYAFGGWYKESACVNVWNFTTDIVTSSMTLYAKWPESNYTITYNLNGGTNGNNPTGYNITSAAITLENPVRDGYTFGGWYTNSTFTGTAVTTIPSGSTGDKAFWAKWTLTNYSITYNLNSGTNGNNPTSYTITSPTITLEEPVRNGYDFGGWYTSSALTGTAVTTIPLGSTGDKALWAKWTLTSYSITYNVNGGTNGSNPSSYTITSQAITLNSPSRNGYDFGGWYTNSTLTGTAVTAIPTGTTGDKTFWAKWTATSYSITYNLNNGINGNNPTSYTITSATITLAEPTRGGYNFGGWFTNSSLTGTAVTAIASGSTGNKEFWAKWNPIQFTVNFIANGGTSVANQVVNSGSTLQTVSSTRSGLTLVGWYREAGFINLWNFASPVTATMTLYAKWLVMDVDGNVYDTVRIGTQTWMVQNLKTTKYRDNTPIPLVTDSTAWANRVTAAFCWPYNFVGDGVVYGAIYNSYVARAANNIAPAGWHVPTQAEFETLVNYVRSTYTSGENPTPALMAVGSYADATNVSGFTGKFAPARNIYGFNQSGQASWYTQTYSEAMGQVSYLFSDNGMSPISVPGFGGGVSGYSIRCIKGD